MQGIYDYIDSHWQEAIEDLKRLCRQPSISAQGVGMTETVQLLVETMGRYGVNVRVLPSPAGRYPFVFAEVAGEASGGLLFYNHYDVQPPEPVELWSSPPFEPTIYDSHLRGRGVSDNKGDILARLLVIKAYRELRLRPPISVKFLIEGEEEIGSPSIGAFVEQNRRLLAADACIWESGGVNWKNEPVVSLGVKGILYVQLEMRGASRDLHSSWATVVPNPAWRLVWALASLKDMDENIVIQGFSDEVLPPSEQDSALVRAMPLDELETKRALGLKEFVNRLSGFAYKWRHISEPTCNICGLDSGYTGPGSKTVLPSVARAKLDFRLVPNQRPEDILDKLRRHLDRHGFSDVLILPGTEGENPARTSPDSPFVRIVADAAREVYGVEPVLVPSMAGTGPMYWFADKLGLPTVLIGVDYPDSRAHAPDENIRLADFILNAKHIAAVLQRMGASARSGSA